MIHAHQNNISWNISGYINLCFSQRIFKIYLGYQDVLQLIKRLKRFFVIKSCCSRNLSSNKPPGRKPVSGPFPSFWDKQQYEVIQKKRPKMVPDLWFLTFHPPLSSCLFESLTEYWVVLFMNNLFILQKQLGGTYSDHKLWDIIKPYEYSGGRGKTLQHQALFGFWGSWAPPIWAKDKIKSGESRIHAHWIYHYWLDSLNKPQ